MKKTVFIVMFILLFLFMLVSIFFSIRYYFKYRKITQYSFISSNEYREENKVILEKLGRLMDLPQDEVPSIAIINGLDNLKQVPLFAKAKIGDRIIIYGKARKAILYDPVEEIIVDVGPFNPITQPGFQESEVQTQNNNQTPQTTEIPDQ